ncbi:MAG: glycosyltransferase [Planctomycetes bacterium]|nr:glycosyltransferase [Planctomycetota bacterium]
MDLSVIIPTHRRAEKLAACVASLAGQELDGSFEVLVGVDGPEDPPGLTQRAAIAAWAGDARLHIEQCEQQGQAAVRNRLLGLARGTTLVFLNDDMVPAPGLLGAHLAAQRACESSGRSALVVGDSPWVVHQPDRLFDRLVRETSMVFFYDRMNQARDDRDRDWGFRHAWLLNLSAPAALVREVGGFKVFPSTYGYEDDELAYRLNQRFGTRVLYRPEAVAQHDHRMQPAEYLAREYRLGYSAWGFANTAPACAQAMFARDVTSDGEIEYAQQFVERERPAAERLETSFAGLADLPADCVSGRDQSRLVDLIYQQHLLLKRWHWRKGLLDAAIS